MKFFYINLNDSKKFIFKPASANADRINSFTYFIEGDMGVYGIAVLGFFFMRYFGNFNFNVRYCGII